MHSGSPSNSWGKPSNEYQNSLCEVFITSFSVNPKQLCELAHLGGTRKAGTSLPSVQEFQFTFNFHSTATANCMYFIMEIEIIHHVSRLVGGLLLAFNFLGMSLVLPTLALLATIHVYGMEYQTLHDVLHPTLVPFSAGLITAGFLLLVARYQFKVNQ